MRSTGGRTGDEVPHVKGGQDRVGEAAKGGDGAPTVGKVFVLCHNALEVRAAWLRKRRLQYQKRHDTYTMLNSRHTFDKVQERSTAIYPR
jgi:hypothetical protein